MKEEYLLEGQLGPPTNGMPWPKIAGIKLGQRTGARMAATSPLPTNLYGPGDNFDLVSSHIVPALIAKMHAAKAENAAEVETWGTARPRCGFLHVDDLADAACTSSSLR